MRAHPSNSGCAHALCWVSGVATGTSASSAQAWRPAAEIRFGSNQTGGCVSGEDNIPLSSHLQGVRRIKGELE
jgi:hypothetical protein